MRNLHIVSGILPFPVLAVALSGCLAPQRGEPLFPVTGPRPKREEIARLDGYVRMVDSQRVDEGKSFELLPGCHIIGTPERWGRVDSTGGVYMDTGRQTFALVMKPGHRYHVDVSLKTMGGSMGTAAIEATEEDAKGKKTGVFAPAESTADIDACKEAASRSAR